MKLLLDIKDNKAAFIIELLKNFPFVKTTTIDESSVSELSESQRMALDEGLNALEEGNTISYNQVMEDTKKRYPNLFK